MSRLPEPERLARLGITLPPGQQRFCEEYLKMMDPQPHLAYLAAYPGVTKQTAYVSSSRLMKNPNVRKYLEGRLQKRSDRIGITQERVLREIDCGAFVDPIHAFNEDGSLKALSEIPEETRRAIAYIEVAEIFTGQGDQRHCIGLLKKVKFVSKETMLTLRGKHMKLFGVDDKTPLQVGPAVVNNVQVTFVNGAETESAEPKVIQGEAVDVSSLPETAQIITELDHES